MHLVAKPIVWTIYSSIYSDLHQPLKYTLNFEVDYNYGHIFQHGIPSQHLIETILKYKKFMGFSLSKVFMVTILSQFKDERLLNLNAYPRRDVICIYNQSENQHRFANIKWIKAGGRPRNESKLYQVVFVQENQNAPQLYGAIKLDVYTMDIITNTSTSRVISDPMAAHQHHHNQISTFITTPPPTRLNIKRNTINFIK